MNAFPDLVEVKREKNPHALQKKLLEKRQVKW